MAGQIGRLGLAASAVSILASIYIYSVYYTHLTLPTTKRV